MVKLVAMFNLSPGTDEAEFEKYFVQKHARDAAKIPGLRKYLIGKVVGSPAGTRPGIGSTTCGSIASRPR